MITAFTLVFLLGACGKAEVEQESAYTDTFSYAVKNVLLTSNAANDLGVATNAQVLSARLYPSTHVPGPKGQLIPNTDFATAQFLPGNNQRVLYTISDKAVYSDGEPVTCDSFLLAFVAGDMDVLFGSHMPLMHQVERVECNPGSKNATVVFKEGFGARWRQLFGPGVLLPAHAIANKAGLTLADLNAALVNRDETTLASIAQIWNQGYSLSNFDPELQVSSGPYKIDSVGQNSEVILSRNDRYFGEPANIEKIVVWPGTTDLKSLAKETKLGIAEVKNNDSLSWVNRDDNYNPYDIVSEAGVLTEQLLLSSSGLFEDIELRKAFAACIDQTAIAQVSSEHAGAEVHPVTVRTVRAHDPVVAQLGDIAQSHLGVDIEAARALEGQTIRIGYLGEDSRKAAIVENIAQTCAPAGINVVDVSGELDEETPRALVQAIVDENGLLRSEGVADAYIQAVDPMVEFDYIPHLSTDVAAVRADELASWEQMITIPLSSHPRVFVVDKNVENVVPNTDLYSIGWNMDRWQPKEQKAQ
ncbi:MULTISPECIES: ABC transporter substrate-binding protein [unclassified Corynebacterium]|uniref:ABC transporter substrate-binding protein n=1 Tax=unclassified Corynebacterium TaxID=2624378 RepID=UPI002104C943|nr:ABC transporter substrate-binding protein [Corynebacterium sp. SY003]